MNNNYKLSPAAIFLAVSAGRSLISIFTYFRFVNFLSLLATVFLCVILFMKRRDILLLAAAAATTFVSLISFFANFGLVSFISLGVHAYVLLLALMECRQNIIKLNLSAIAPFFKKFFFLPAAALVLNFVIVSIRYIIWHAPFSAFFNTFFSYGLSVCAMYFLCSWLLDPTIIAVPFGMGYVYAESTDETAASGSKADVGDIFAAPSAERYVPAEGSNYCPLGKHIVLTLVTCGVWFYMWIYRTTRYLNSAPGAQQYVPVKKLLLCLFVPYYYIYWFCKHARRLTDLSNEKNPAFSDQNTMYILFGIFIPVVACILMQVRINNIEMAAAPAAQPAAPQPAAAPVAAQPAAAPTGNKSVSLSKGAPAPAPAAAPVSNEQSNIDALRSYKELLDSGVITKEEFDAKKRQILGL